MEKFVEFVGNNYSWFLTISIVLLFALIGYIYDTKKSKNNPINKIENELSKEDLENLNVPEGKSLQEMVNHSKDIDFNSENKELADDLANNKEIEILSNDDN